MTGATMDELVRLADLIKQRNALEQQITALTGRPAALGHLGEYIASKIFGIALATSASQKSIDGHFLDGPLAGRSVNIKWYAKQEGLLDVTAGDLPDFYLVLAGPKAQATSSRSMVRPWSIEAVYCFDAQELVRVLQMNGVRLGIATSVRQHLWQSVEIYPSQRSRRLIISDRQRKLLDLFR